MKKRDTYRYELRDGRKLVYAGVTNNPERRLSEHSREKQFGRMHIMGPVVTKETALKWERDRVTTYRRNQGKNPRYNRNL